MKRAPAIHAKTSPPATPATEAVIEPAASTRAAKFDRLADELITIDTDDIRKMLPLRPTAPSA